jgi:glycosylphosphatidylinositol transamidase (GPIT) subunit GPI8
VTGPEENIMMVLIHKECGGPAMEDSTVGEVCAIPIDRFPFSCFSCLEEIVDESELRLSEDLGI